MPDSRFFACDQGLSLVNLAELTGALLGEGADGTRIICAAAPLGRAGQDAVSFFSDRRRASELAATAAGAVFLRKGAITPPAGAVALYSNYPQAAWAAALSLLHPAVFRDEADTAIHPHAILDADVQVAFGASVGPGAHIGARTRIGAGAHVGAGVTIGRDCVVGANATVQCALIGDRVTLLAGARIGEAGFAVADGQQGPVEVPQVGRVILQDGVSVGANSCIDRGGWDDTVVGENTKIDNLVHIAHNVRIGRNCRLAAYTGIAGSVVIGDGVMFGGKAGVIDWLTIGDGAVIGSTSTAFKNVPAGETWSGIPARPLRRWLREQASLARLAQKGSKHEED